MILIDGNQGEGGGQILRTALAMSALTGKSFKITDIRKGRPQPGLKSQHLNCVKAAKTICNADVTGDALGSTAVTFEPRKILPGKYEIDIETAGSTTLLLQSIMLPLMFADKKSSIKIKGGTDVEWSMPIDYFNFVLLPHLQKFAHIKCELIKRGHYPRGNGELDIVIRPKFSIYEAGNVDQLIETIGITLPKKINLLVQGSLLQIKGISHATKDLLDSKVAERQAESAREHLRDVGCVINISEHYVDSLSTGSGITLWAMCGDLDTDVDNPVRLGVDVLGRKGKRAEDIGKEAAENLLREINSKAPVDEHLADNLIPFLVFSGKMKVSRISDHCRSNIYVLEQFLGPVFEIDEPSNMIKSKFIGKFDYLQKEID